MDDFDDFLADVTPSTSSAWLPSPPPVPRPAPSAGAAGMNASAAPQSAGASDAFMFEMDDFDSAIGELGLESGFLSRSPGLDILGTLGKGNAAHSHPRAASVDISPLNDSWFPSLNDSLSQQKLRSDTTPPGIMYGGSSSSASGTGTGAGTSVGGGTASASQHEAASARGAYASSRGGSHAFGHASLPFPLSGTPSGHPAADGLRAGIYGPTGAIAQAQAQAQAAGARQGAEQDSEGDDEDEEENEEDGDMDVGQGGLAGGGKGGDGGVPGGAGRVSGGGKKGGSSNSLKGLGADERRAQRLERNRESARQSRRRKKEYLDLLEQRVSALQQQIFEVRTSHAAASTVHLQELKMVLLTAVEPLAYKEIQAEGANGYVYTPEEEATLDDAASQLVDRFGPDCAERRAVRDFHFDQLQRLLLPPHTKFLLWLVHQPAEFFAVSTAGPEGAEAATAPAATGLSPAAGSGAGTGQQQLGISIWTLLCQEIGLSVDQAEKLRGQLRKVVGGPEFPRETWRLGVAAVYLQRLRAALDTSARKLQLQYEALRAILTPAQLIRYCGWVERHRGRLGRDVVEAVTVTGPRQGVPVAAGVAGAAQVEAVGSARGSAGAAGAGAGAAAGAGGGVGISLTPTSAWAAGVASAGVGVGLGSGRIGVSGPHVPGAVEHGLGTGALSPLGL